MRTVLTETVDQTQVGSHPEARGVSPSRNLNYVIPLAVVGLASVACGGGSTTTTAPVSTPMPSVGTILCSHSVKFEPGDTFFGRPLREAKEHCPNLNNNDAVLSADKAGIKDLNQIQAGKTVSYNDYSGY